MKILFVLLVLAQSIYGIPVYEFFSKGSPEYYRTNATNIFDFFNIELKWRANEYSELFRRCSSQYESFGLELREGLKVNLFKIKVNLDQPRVQELSYYCKISYGVNEQIAKLKKPSLKADEYYYFRWNILKSSLEIYSIQKTPPPNGEVALGKALPLYLSNIQTKTLIYFVSITDSKEKAAIHPMMDINYPALFDPSENEFEISVVETNPLFFPTATRAVFKAFNTAFGIIPDRISIRNKVPMAVMP